MFGFEGPYTDLFRTKIFRSSGKPTVLHRRTCPNCGKKLVNLYYSAQAERYICKECLDAILTKGGENDNANGNQRTL